MKHTINRQATYIFELNSIELNYLMETVKHANDPHVSVAQTTSTLLEIQNNFIKRAQDCLEEKANDS